MLASILLTRCPLPAQRTHPKDTANSLMRPASNVESQGIGQNLALIHAHWQGLAHNGDTGRCSIHRETSLFLTHDLKFPIVSQPKIQYQCFCWGTDKTQIIKSLPLASLRIYGQLGWYHISYFFLPQYWGIQINFNWECGSPWKGLLPYCRGKWCTKCAWHNTLSTASLDLDLSLTLSSLFQLALFQ
jgi:hypothetical protein